MVQGVEVAKLRSVIRISPGSQGLGKGFVGRKQPEQRQEGSKSMAGMGSAHNWLLKYKVTRR